MKREELNEKQVILRMILGAELVLKIDSREGGWLKISKKGKAKVSHLIASGLVGGDFLTRVNADDGTDEFRYITDIPSKIKKMNKIPKEELSAFVMYAWNANIEPAKPENEYSYNNVECWFRSIRREFYLWYAERKFYLSIVNKIVNLKKI